MCSAPIFPNVGKFDSSFATVCVNFTYKCDEIAILNVLIHPKNHISFLVFLPGEGGRVRKKANIWTVDPSHRFQNSDLTTFF